MAEPFLAEIRIFGFNFPPRNWAFCDGQILPINQNQSLYSLLGTIYGGDGRTTFALPDLRGRSPIHRDSTISLGARSGEESHALTTSEVPPHTHTLRGSNQDASDTNPDGNVLADVQNVSGVEQYIQNGDTAMNAGNIAPAGAGEGHDNMQPYLVLSFAIAIMGTFPSRN